ncbi:MAG: hypothetical protein PHQ23_07120 [Candidatus Wallbacteria bacterium]|nr:hypothetical protein [Candidatus Wallbacteria bacterium]
METKAGFFYTHLGPVVGTSIAAILTLAIYSFLYKDNYVYRLAEYIFIGVSNGYLLAVNHHNSLIPNFWDPLTKDHKYWLIIPGILGLMMLGRLSSKYAWTSRWPIAFSVGMGAGLGITATIMSDIYPQLQETMLPIMGVGFGQGICNLTIVVGVLTSLFYFFFSTEHKGIAKNISYAGICFLMITFGGSFGYTVMARISLLIGRMNFLLEEWLHLSLS